jgi:2'-5' RNA ligase
MPVDHIAGLYGYHPGQNQECHEAEENIQSTNINLQVDRVALYQSTLTDAGSIYLALKEI